VRHRTAANLSSTRSCTGQHASRALWHWLRKAIALGSGVGDGANIVKETCLGRSSLYILELHPLGVAWENLRRNPNYRNDWGRFGSDPYNRVAQHWGYGVLENPQLEARNAHPQWHSAPAPVLRIRQQISRSGCVKIARDSHFFIKEPRLTRTDLVHRSELRRIMVCDPYT
jgi:hypothetical protein